MAESFLINLGCLQEQQVILSIEPSLEHHFKTKTLIHFSTKVFDFVGLILGRYCDKGMKEQCKGFFVRIFEYVGAEGRSQPSGSSSGAICLVS